MVDKQITNEYLFPRSEYYSRFQGTSAFKMDNPDYWGTYHRSEGTRHFTKVGGRKNAAFESPCTKKPPKANSFSAHTGGVSSPFNNEGYSKAITLKKKIPKSIINVRDCLLHYKRQIADTVVSSFEKAINSNSQKTSKQNNSPLRPIVFYENGYPCVLIKLPALNPLETKGASTSYWAKHPKPFQKLLLASFVALLNHNACEAGIPIEIVIRSSFGHNLPSVCETDNTFRINVGLVPEAYAKLMGKTLQELNKTINKLMEMPTLNTEFSREFRNKVRNYNAKKLKKAIDSKPLYAKLRETEDYKKAEVSSSSFEKLYQSFLNLKKNKKKGYANFIPVRLESNTVWDVIQEPGDSMGKSVLSECFRKNETVDWFADAVMDGLSEGNSPSFSIEIALQKLTAYLTYGTAVSMSYDKIHRDLNQVKLTFDSISFDSFYKNDSSFNAITLKLFKALCAERPDTAMYSALERAGVNFFSTYRGSDEIEESADYGSDSEFSDNFSVDEQSLQSENTENDNSDSSYDGQEDEQTEEDDNSDNKGEHFSHKKLRVCSGMKAIVLAQYAALSYLSKQGIKAFRKDVEQMYYEVENAVKMVNVSNIQENKIRANAKGQILHYDLNYCNAANRADTTSLDEKLSAIKPTIVVLDYTSSTIAELKSAAKQCFSQKQVKFIFLVHSGLKNGQAGLDFNPYGEIRVMARNSKLRDQIMKILKQGLAEKDKSSQKVHEMVRASKRRGLEISLFGLFKNDSRRFQPVEEPNIINECKTL